MSILIPVSHYGLPSVTDPIPEKEIERVTAMILAERAKTAPPVKVETPLATAAWHVGPFKHYVPADFFIGFQNRGGPPVGVQEDRHVFVTAGTRSGKGVSVLIPNLVMRPGSVVVIDPKGENALVTARRRAGGSPWCYGLGQKTFILDPFNEVRRQGDDFSDLKASFNPLDLLDPNEPESVDHAARIADSCVIAENVNEPFWSDSGRTLIKTVSLHVASAREFEGRRNLLTVRELLIGGDRKARAVAEAAAGEGKEPPSGLSLLFASMRRNNAFNGLVARHGALFGDLERNAARTMANIVQVVDTHTEFLESPGMRRVLEKSDFSLSDLKADPKGIALYFCLPQRMAGTHFRWLRMMTTLTISEMERNSAPPACGHRVLLMVDEFPALRRMRVIEDAAAQIAGFHVQMVLVAQTLAQLKDNYKDNWETLLANAGVKMFFSNDDHFTREYVSKLIGEQEIMRMVKTITHSTGESSSTSLAQGSSFTQGGSTGATYGSRGGISNNIGRSHGATQTITSTYSKSENTSRSEGVSETLHKRALVTPDEVGRLFGNRERPAALVLCTGMQPFELHRPSYFNLTGLRGTYDWHPSHAVPLTKSELQEARKAEELREILARQRANQIAREQAEKLRKEAIARILQKRKSDIASSEWELARQREKERRRFRENLVYSLQMTVLFIFAVAIGAVCFTFGLRLSGSIPVGLVAAGAVLGFLYYGWLES